LRLEKDNNPKNKNYCGRTPTPEITGHSPNFREIK
jgi:hypothetical protein